MNTFLQSNKSSALLSVVDGSATKDLYDYKTSATPNPATERVEIQPNGGVQGFSTIATYDLPAYGILDRVILRFRVTLPQKNNTTTGYLGINALNYVEVASQNKVICRVTREQLVGKFANMTASESHNAQRYLRYVEKNSTGNDALGGKFLCYTDVISKYLTMRKQQPILSRPEVSMSLSPSWVASRERSPRLRKS